MKHLFTILLSLAAFAEQPSPTDSYLALTATLLEHRIIGDEHLLRMIDGLLNPILETEAQIDSQKLIASQAYDNLLREPIDASQLAPWAKERLSQEGKEREEKKKKQDETQNPWKSQPERLAVDRYDRSIYFVTKEGELLCSDLNCPQLGKIYGISLANTIICAIVQNGLSLKCWRQDKIDHIFEHKDLDAIVDIKSDKDDDRLNFFCVKRKCAKLTCFQLKTEYDVNLKRDIFRFSTYFEREKIRDFSISRGVIWFLTLDHKIGSSHDKDELEDKENSIVKIFFQYVNDENMKLCVIYKNSTHACSGLNTGTQKNVDKYSVETIILDNYNNYFISTTGAIGDLEKGFENLNVPPDIKEVTSISLGSGISCVNTKNDSVDCWGQNFNPEIGFFSKDKNSISRIFKENEIFLQKQVKNKSDKILVCLYEKTPCFIDEYNTVRCKKNSFSSYDKIYDEWNGLTLVDEFFENKNQLCLRYLCGAVECLDNYYTYTYTKAGCSIKENGYLRCWGILRNQLEIPNIQQVTINHRDSLCALSEDGFVYWGDPRLGHGYERLNSEPILPRKYPKTHLVISIEKIIKIIQSMPSYFDKLKEHVQQMLTT